MDVVDGSEGLFGRESVDVASEGNVSGPTVSLDAGFGSESSIEADESSDGEKKASALTKTPSRSSISRVAACTLIFTLNRT